MTNTKHVTNYKPVSSLMSSDYKEHSMFSSFNYLVERGRGRGIHTYNHILYNAAKQLDKVVIYLLISEIPIRLLI